MYEGLEEVWLYECALQFLAVCSETRRLMTFFNAHFSIAEFTEKGLIVPGGVRYVVTHKYNLTTVEGKLDDDCMALALAHEDYFEIPRMAYNKVHIQKCAWMVKYASQHMARFPRSRAKYVLVHLIKS